VFSFVATTFFQFEYHPPPGRLLQRDQIVNRAGVHEWLADDSFGSPTGIRYFGSTRVALDPAKRNFLSRPQ
jgi:hypothetical protein